MTFKWSVKSTKVQQMCTDVVVGTREPVRNFEGRCPHVKKTASVGLSILGWQGQCHCHQMLLGTVVFSWGFARSHSQCSISGQKGRLAVAGTQRFPNRGEGAV